MVFTQFCVEYPTAIPELGTAENRANPLMALACEFLLTYPCLCIQMPAHIPSPQTISLKKPWFVSFFRYEHLTIL